jgi:hypothetical protein
MTLAHRKYRLIKLITDLTDETLLQKLEQLLVSENEQDKLLFQSLQPMREKLDIEDLAVEQDYTHPESEEIEEIIKEADIQEPIEKLLKMI